MTNGEKHHAVTFLDLTERQKSLARIKCLEQSERVHLKCSKGEFLMLRKEKGISLKDG